MILWTTLFFCFPGLLTFLPVHNVFSRLHPAIVETGLCLLLGISAFSKAGVSILLPASCRQELHLSPLQLKNMRKLISYLFFLLSGHTLLVYAAILFLSPSTAKFVSSTLLCLLLGTFFSALYIRNRILSSKMKKKNGSPLSMKKEKSQEKHHAACAIPEANCFILSFIFTSQINSMTFSCKKEV